MVLGEQQAETQTQALRSAHKKLLLELLRSPQR